MKKSGETKIYTKEELLELMNSNLTQQIKMSKSLEIKYAIVENSDDPEDRKKRNSLQNQLNAQYDAINRTCNQIIKTSNSKYEQQEDDIENANEQKPKEKDEELVD